MGGATQTRDRAASLSPQLGTGRWGAAGKKVRRQERLAEVVAADAGELRKRNGQEEIVRSCELAFPPRQPFGASTEIGCFRAGGHDQDLAQKALVQGSLEALGPVAYGCDFVDEEPANGGVRWVQGREIAKDVGKMAVVAKMVAVEIEPGARAKLLDGLAQGPFDPGGLAELTRSSNQDQTRFAGKVVETELVSEDEARRAEKIQVGQQSRALDFPSQQRAVDLVLCVEMINVHNVDSINVHDVGQMGGGAPDKLRGLSAEAVAKLGQSFAERNDVDLSEAVVLMAAVEQ